MKSLKNAFWLLVGIIIILFIVIGLSAFGTISYIFDDETLNLILLWISAVITVIGIWFNSKINNLNK